MKTRRLFLGELLSAGAATGLMATRAFGQNPIPSPPQPRPGVATGRLADNYLLRHLVNRLVSWKRHSVLNNSRMA